MKLTLLSTLIAAPLLVKGTPSTPACPPGDATPAQQEANFRDFANLFQVQKLVSEPFLKYVDEGYIQHNLLFGQGRDAAIKGLSALDRNSDTTIVNLGFVDNVGFIHHYEAANGTARKFADFYRMEGGCIVEHWDVIATLTPEEINPVPA